MAGPISKLLALESAHEVDPMQSFAKGYGVGDLIRQGNERKDKQALSERIGGMLASGDRTGAARAAYEGGALDDGMKLEGAQEDAIKQLGTFAAQILSLPPEQQEGVYMAGAPQMIALARRAGLPVPNEPEPYDDNQRAALRAIAARAGALSAPAAGEKGFTLGQGQKRFDAQGNEIASVAPKAVGSGGNEIILPDGTVVRTVGLSGEQRGRIAVAAPIMGPVLDQTEALFRDKDGKPINPMNDARNIGAAAVSGLPGGDAAARFIGGEEYQRIMTPFKQIEALLLPAFSGAAVTPSEAQRFIDAGVPSVGDTPQNIQRKFAYLRGLEKILSAAVVGQLSPDLAKAQIGQLFAEVNAQTGGNGSATGTEKPQSDGWGEMRVK